MRELSTGGISETQSPAWLDSSTFFPDKEEFSEREEASTGKSGYLLIQRFDNPFVYLSVYFRRHVFYLEKYAFEGVGYIFGF